MFSYFSIFSALVLSVVIHFVASIALSGRIVATRTKLTATTLSIYNVLTALGQLAVSIQMPLLAKETEVIIVNNIPFNLSVFRLIIFGCTLGVVIGAFAIPTFHRFMEKGVKLLYQERSLAKVLFKSMKLKTALLFFQSITFPNKHTFGQITDIKGMPIKIVVLNTIITAFMCVTVLSSLYAGYLSPTYRTTALSLNPISISIGVALMLLFVEPYNATITDKVIEGSVSHSFFRKYLTFLLVGRVIGTILAQLLLVPLAHFIIIIAKWI
jgi:hypothetical protein